VNSKTSKSKRNRFLLTLCATLGVTLGSVVLASSPASSNYTCNLEAWDYWVGSHGYAKSQLDHNYVCSPQIIKARLSDGSYTNWGGRAWSPDPQLYWYAVSPATPSGYSVVGSLHRLVASQA